MTERNDGTQFETLPDVRSHQLWVLLDLVNKNFPISHEGPVPLESISTVFPLAILRNAFVLLL